MGYMGINDKFNRLSLELMKHKYRYYVLCRPTISDFSYDRLEREWYLLGTRLGFLSEGDSSPCIDFDTNHQLANEAIEVVEYEDMIERYIHGR